MNNTFDKSISTPAKYLSWNESFCVGSIKCVNIPIISLPFSVLLTLSNSSIYIIGFIHLVSIIISTIRPHVEFI